MKILFFFFLFWTQLCSGTEILTATFSKRQVTHITLANGLEAVLISDPQMDQSGAALTVQAGSWDEPEAYPGLAHFLEHMLFLGTKKYPDEGDYQRYISHYNGQANAFTSPTYTAYLFTIDNNAFPEALDRFSQFFKEPLFNPSGVDRELQAIEQEYAKNIEDDGSRLYFVQKELANPAHPDHRFSIGNKSTLGNVSQQTLKDWYAQNYSASVMRLEVYSVLPTEQLKSLVTTDFSDVVNNGKTARTFPEMALPESLHGKIISVQPVKNLRTVTLMWELPASVSAMRETKPDSLISYVLGHEGRESLLAELKREQLAEGLKVGSFNKGNTTLLFELEIALTDKGLAQINTVLTRVFQALAVLRQEGVPQSLFDEIQQLATLSYQYQERKPLFETLMQDVFSLPFYDLAEYPENVSIPQRYDGAAVKEILEQLTPDKAFIFLTVPPTLSPVPLDKKEPWLGVPYGIGSEKIQVGEGPHPKITLPAPNPFIPKNLTLVVPSLPADQLPLVPSPKKLVNGERGILYYAADQRYGTPIVSYLFEIQTPAVDAGKPTKVVMADLAVKAAQEWLSKVSYPAEMAGLSYEISRTDYGIGISVNGYSEHAPKFFAEILRRLSTLQPPEDRFELYQKILEREYQNALRDLPIKQANDIMKSALYKDYSTARQKSQALRRITFEKFNEYLKGLFTSTFTQAVVYGNATEEQALALWDTVQQALPGKPTTPRQQMAILLPKDEGPFYIEANTKSQGNAVVLAIEGDGYSFTGRAAQQILGQILEDAFFAELRTRQQTGYIVLSWNSEIALQLFQFFADQSTSHDVQDLRARFDLFLEGFVQELSHTTTEETFQHVKEALLTQLQTPQKNTKDTCLMLQEMAFKLNGDFDWMNKRIEGFRTLSYEQFLEFSRNFLGKQNRRKLAVLLKGVMPEDAVSYEKLGSVQQLKKLGEWKGPKGRKGHKGP